MAQAQRSYLIRSVPGEPDWSGVPSLPVDQVLWTPDRGIRASAQLCHDQSFLHVRLSALEAAIRAEYTAPLSPVWEDSCLEFFFMPEGGDRYFNFEINPNGCLHTGFGRSRADRAVLCREDAGSFFAVRTGRAPGGWLAAYRIPLSFLRLFLPEFAFSGRLRANVYKCGDLTPEAHYLSWNPVASKTPDFHRPEDFGLMIFDC